MATRVQVGARSTRDSEAADTDAQGDGVDHDNEDDHAKARKQAAEDELSAACDALVRWLHPRIALSLRPGEERWRKFTNSTESMAALQAFIKETRTRMVVVQFNSRDELIASLVFSAALRKKCVVVSRRMEGVAVTAASVGVCLAHCDLQSPPLEHLDGLLDRVFRPALTECTTVGAAWPHVLSQDVTRHMGQLSTALHAALGLSKGNIVLPVPSEEELSVANPNKQRSLLHSLESCVIEWTNTIKESVHASPPQLGSDPLSLPLAEIDFWAAREAKLRAMRDQLGSRGVVRVAEILAQCKSSYSHSFARITRDVDTAYAEATDVSLHMRTLRPYFERLTQASTSGLESIVAVFGPMFKTLQLVWQHSTCLHSPPRIIRVIQLVTGCLVAQVRDFLNWEALLTMDGDDALHMLDVALDVADCFSAEYSAAKASTLTLSPADGWRFADEAVLGDFDAFVDRMVAMREAMQTAYDFSRLEKIDVGGPKGRALTSDVHEVWGDFCRAYEAFRCLQADPFGAGAGDFDRRARWFRACVAALDERIGCVIDRGLADCDVTGHYLATLDTFAGLVGRPAVRRRIDGRYEGFVGALSREIDWVHASFVAGRNNPPIHKNMPPTAGALVWIAQLRDTLKTPWTRFLQLDDSIKALPTAVDCERKYNYLLRSMAEAEEGIRRAWAQRVDRDARDSLCKPLLRRAGADLAVNFDDALAAAMRELKYRGMLGLEMQVPTAIAPFDSETEAMRVLTTKLGIVAAQYNSVRRSVAPPEAPLVAQMVAHIDRLLCRGTDGFVSWESSAALEYVSEVQMAVEDLSTRTERLIVLVQEAADLTSRWAAPILTRRVRKDGTRYLPLDERPARRDARAKEVRAGVRRIAAIVDDIFALFSVAPQSRERIDYLAHMDALVSAAAEVSVRASVGYVLEQIADNRPEASTPLVEVQLDVVAPGGPVFTPELDGDSPSCVEALLCDIFMDAAGAFHDANRLVGNCDGDYGDLLLADTDLADLQRDLMMQIDAAVVSCKDYCAVYTDYEPLWMRTPTEALARFLSASKQGSLFSRSEVWADDPPNRRGDDLRSRTVEGCYGAEEFDANGSAAFVVPMDIDALAVAVGEIDSMVDTALRLPSSVDHERWLRVDMRPARQSLSVSLQQWRQGFADELRRRAEGLLRHLTSLVGRLTHAFPADRSGIQNHDDLIKAMGDVHTVRRLSAGMPARFEWLTAAHHCIETTARCKAPEMAAEIDSLQTAWQTIVHAAEHRQDALGPMQAKEGEALVARREEYAASVAAFRALFVERAPIRDGTSHAQAYREIDALAGDVAALERKGRELESYARMLGENAPLPPDVGDCWDYLRALKRLWDVAALADGLRTSYAPIAWADLDTRVLERDAKLVVGEVAAVGLHAFAKGAPAFHALQARARGMIDSARLVSDLCNSAIRPRHWNEFAAATSLRLAENGILTLGDVLAVDLPAHEADVAGVVDRAIKEQGMERLLADVSATWGAMEATFDTHDRTAVALVRVPPEFAVALEDNQVALQTMLASKYVVHFFSEITGWQQRLLAVESTMYLWMEVQSAWSYLESIFGGSADIRQQLPEDGERFDACDVRWRALMAAAVARSHVVTDLCADPRIMHELEVLRAQLALCEKALVAYLEHKRVAFPRFYFVSSADLLDILAKGAQPSLVSMHLSKLFGSLTQLEFQRGGDGAQRNIVVGLYSREGEYLELPSPCHLLGPVESWLGTLEKEMRGAVQHAISLAVASYGEKLREHWLLDHAAQAGLVAAQVWWTTEVAGAFVQLEEGRESAMKEYNKKLVAQLQRVITIVQGDLTPLDRQKIVTACTVDVHARDVVSSFIRDDATSQSHFGWQSQLRMAWDETTRVCAASICDARFHYDFEYLGNCPRLVMTPLTDRCYIALTQSLRLMMGGAPSGPAGTGKTETCKDLGRTLGMMVYVFNCSDQMDYRSLGDTFKGLAQTGAWGCFDEFNRISAEVLSVVSTQVKSILDALRAAKTHFDFQGDIISLRATVGLFVTMNPGYSGRVELPENIKALFRPCAMVVPDTELICEIMLLAEGFLETKALARKFSALYRLCSELLSRQDHYDWGLRAMKSVLVVAGAQKRADPDSPEDHVLLRAMRDSNVPKIVAADSVVFAGLINDLFPRMDIPRRVDAALDSAIRQSLRARRLQAEDPFVLKVTQLSELLAVRHSVFILGPAGTGKSAVWRTLADASERTGRRVLVHDMNPKAVSVDELFGCVDPLTREWHDGVFSSTMRTFSAMPGDDYKWIVLDGEIDPMWIESLNSVMDDSKVLTLASNERVAHTSSMRLVFEIDTLAHANPSTVSRAGILFMSAADFGWRAFVQSWVETLPHSPALRSNLLSLAERYVGTCLSYLSSGRVKTAVPMSDIGMVQALCVIVQDALCVRATLQAVERDAKVLEGLFAFACVWAFGGTLSREHAMDHRVEFSGWWRNEWRAVPAPARFPATGTVFDHAYDAVKGSFVPWEEMAGPEEARSVLVDAPMFVRTPDTIRTAHFLRVFVAAEKPAMIVGPGGCGKTALVRAVLGSLGDDRIPVDAPLHYFSSAATLQSALEKRLERKSGRSFGPPGLKKIVYFVDDLNMPQCDEFGTQSPHTLIRQHLDYGHWYDRAKLSLKHVSGVQYVACMNPTAGSFHINARLQRHFCVLAMDMPDADSIKRIYAAVFAQRSSEYLPAAAAAVDAMLSATVLLHRDVTTVFLPTAVNFHYLFNLRDLSRVFGGIAMASASAIRTPIDMCRLWMHETQRVYRDRMSSADDHRVFDDIQSRSLRRHLPDLDHSKLHDAPLIYANFAHGAAGEYGHVAGWAELKRCLETALDDHNDSNAAMDLVLFEDAMAHVCRIWRVLESPGGHALLIGVGGSGKQSLARLAAHLGGHEVHQISLRKGYELADFKEDVSGVLRAAGVREAGAVFLLTDSQIVSDDFLVLLNELLTTGYIEGLFSDDDAQAICDLVRSEARSVTGDDSRDACWSYFVAKVRRNLHVVLCFSPMESSFRARCRKFPSIFCASSIDWFMGWPAEALASVAARFVGEISLVPAEQRDAIVRFMAYVHQSVNQIAGEYAEVERRRIHTTPKTFLELLRLYRSLLEGRHGKLSVLVERLEGGLSRLTDASRQVDVLHDRLAVQEEQLSEKRKVTDAMLVQVDADSRHAESERKLADEEARVVDAITRDVAAKQQECAGDLALAEPALHAAVAALNTLNKPNLIELKSFNNPGKEVQQVMAATAIMLSRGKPIPRDLSWGSTKKAVGQVDKFLEALIAYDKDNIPDNVLAAVRPYTDNPEFNGAAIRVKSVAAAGLCDWITNVVKYYEIFRDVEPKRQALRQANASLAESQARLDACRRRVAEIDARLIDLRAAFAAATAEKDSVQRAADETAATIALADRLVRGLASEKLRWSASAATCRRQCVTMPGDVALASAFACYLGGYNRAYRAVLLRDKWVPYLREERVLLGDGVDPLAILADDRDMARWRSEGLPKDRFSQENAAILCNCLRWPLMVDPQMQGLRWLRAHEASRGLRVLRQGQRGFLDAIERGLAGGDPVLLESVPEHLDPVLEPLLSRATVKKGRFIRIGDKEVEFDRNFRLYLHSKMANPHFPPELQAQITMIDFTVTREGLEDQLLAEVVMRERPDLEQRKAELAAQQSAFREQLRELEDALLKRIATAEGNFLGDTQLVENLENTKATALEIEAKVREAERTEALIDETREKYRPVASRASLMYFLINDLHRINPMYQFSLAAFQSVFAKALAATLPSDTVERRVADLADAVTHGAFLYACRGLFERDRLTFATQMALQVLAGTPDSGIEPTKLDFVLRGPRVRNAVSPFEWMGAESWAAVTAIKSLAGFAALPADIQQSEKRWKKWYEAEVPEMEQLPQDWKHCTSFDRMCVIRALRPDRMTNAVAIFIGERMGRKYVELPAFRLADALADTDARSPVFFALSPGVDPVKDVEELAASSGGPTSLAMVSLGQGQEPLAEMRLRECRESGGWVLLQNIHLVQRWLPRLERLIEDFADEGVHPDARIFLTAEVLHGNGSLAVPASLLEASVKVTNEPPMGLRANLLQALDTFTTEAYEQCTNEEAYKGLLFSLCYFHAVVVERRRFGPQGWSRAYPFGIGDLKICRDVLLNHLEDQAAVPWTDLRYIVGEIMYGGHVTDTWDRRLCSTYLDVLFRPEILDGRSELAPGFSLPPVGDLASHRRHAEGMPAESPFLYGMHPNAEIGVFMARTDALFRSILELQPLVRGSGAGVAMEHKVKAVLDDILDRLPDVYPIDELLQRVVDRNPYVSVALQECALMNRLVTEMKRSLVQLELGLKGDLAISDVMDSLMRDLFLDAVPRSWSALAYPSLKSLGPWVDDLLLRARELESWISTFSLPVVVWLPGLFNPQAFLTAVMQVAARKNDWALDKLTLQCEVTRKDRDTVDDTPRDGAMLWGMCLEGARWDSALGVLQDGALKELHPRLPVMCVRAIPAQAGDRGDAAASRGMYRCPVYRTRDRGNTYVWSFNLRTKEPPSKWTLAGVAMLLSA